MDARPVDDVDDVPVIGRFISRADLFQDFMTQ